MVSLRSVARSMIHLLGIVCDTRKPFPPALLALLWEEKGEGTGKQFVEVLNPLHKFFLGKLFLTMDLSVRQEIMRLIYTEGEQINQNDMFDIEKPSVWNRPKGFLEKLEAGLGYGQAANDP